MARLEQYFGFRIEQPRFGDPNGIYFGGRFLTRETCSHIYTAHRIVQAIERKGLSLPIRVVEIGGGFGGTCYWTTKLLGSRLEEYVVIDLPEVELVQALFLGKAFPDRLVLPGESSVGISSPIRLVPYNEIETVLFRPNVVLNQDSMPEMPVAEVRRYLEWISRNLDGVFLSFNQETYSKGGADLQVCVPEVVAVFPNLRRISRETSWDRRGYVEETYETVK
jgi:putative sugar O-methyltransferase